MKKFLLCTLMLIVGCCLFSACEKDGDGSGGLKKSDMYGTWYSNFSHQDCDKLIFNRDGTYLFDGYYTSYRGNWSFDGSSRTWIEHREDGKSYTNIIHTLNDHTLSYTDNYGNHNIWQR